MRGGLDGYSSTLIFKLVTVCRRDVLGHICGRIRAEGRAPAKSGYEDRYVAARSRNDGFFDVFILVFRGDVALLELRFVPSRHAGVAHADIGGPEHEVMPGALRRGPGCASNVD